MSDDPLDIATRHGLPDEFKVLLDRYPRAGWRDDPGFSDLVAFWLDRHLMFREVLSRIPGLGGVLDVLDSLILTIPFVYYYVRTFLVW